MLRFDASGEILWMSSAARQVFGQVTGVASLLTAPRSQPPLARLPLGGDWLWLGVSREDSFAEPMQSIQRALADVFFLWGAQQRQLLRAHSLFLDTAYAAAHRRAFHRLEHEVVAAVEDERDRIARDLHDSASQLLTGIRLNLELVERHLGSANAEALARLNRSRDLAGAALEEIRRIVHGLRYPDFDFPDFVESKVQEMVLRDKFRVEIGPICVPQDLSVKIKHALRFVLQEGLNNVVKHSGASRVRIEAPLVSGSVCLVLEDDGCGFDPAALPPGGGMGLQNMRERIARVGGRLEITSAPGRGVGLRATVPVRRARAAGA